MAEIATLDRRPPAGLPPLDRRPPAGLVPPLNGRPAAGGPTPPQHSGVTFSLAPPMQRWIFRGSPQAARACGTAFGVDLPTLACRANAQGEKAALWLGPDEWLLLCAPGAEFDPRGLPAPHSVVNVSHRQLGIEIAGPGAGQLLNSHVNLDFDLHSDRPVFPAEACTRTIFGKAEIVLWRRGPAQFHIEVWRSFAAYVTGLLGQP